MNDKDLNNSWSKEYIKRMKFKIYPLLVSCITMKFNNYRAYGPIFLSLLSMLMLMLNPGVLKAQEKHPNIIYVLADDMGVGDISIYNPNG